MTATFRPTYRCSQPTFKDKFPDIQGSSTPLLGQTLTLPVYNCFEAAAGFPYVQMLHCPAKDHWLTIQVQFDEDVTVFDGTYSQVSLDVKKQIVPIINKSQHVKINLKVEKIQQQTNNTDCEIYRICGNFRGM